LDEIKFSSLYRLILSIFVFFSCCLVYSQKDQEQIELDSILKLREASKNPSFLLSKRISLAIKAIELSEALEIDSTIIKSKRNLSSIYLKEKDLKSLKSINFNILDFARKAGDTATIANANFILGYVNREEVRLDSAYFYFFEATKFYDAIDNHKKSVSILYNMASIQHSERDYVGSSITAVSAIRKLEKLPKTAYNIDYLWALHNLLGIVSSELQEYDEAIKQYETSLEYGDQLTERYYYNLFGKNNIASVYRKMGDFDKAIEKFQLLLEEKGLKTNDSSTYASALGNLAYSKFLKGIDDKEDIYKEFREALKVVNNLEEPENTMAIQSYYSEFLEKIGEQDSAKYYVNSAYNIAKENDNNFFILETLKIKSKLSQDSSSYFLNKHIHLNDSLVIAERSIRNKFAVINYKVDSITEEKEQISRQNLWLIVASSILATGLLLVYIIKTRREKRKELELQQQQQKANEEIYNLMLSQQDKMDEASAIEKKKISQEIHDGILGRLFGVRLNLDNLNFVKTDDAITSRSNYINELKEIEVDIRKVSHDLNTDFVSNSSFSEIINTLLETQCDAYGLFSEADIEKDINWDALSNKTKVHIYRITQETLQNIYKHAEASLASLSLKQDNNLLSLSISDNGKGYDNTKKKDGIGLKNIKSRVDEIKARLNIETSKNKGTTITIQVPL